MITDKNDSVTVVCLKWHAPDHVPDRKRFTSRHVNALKTMVDNHMRVAHRFVCITDNPQGIDSSVQTAKLPAFYANMRGCYPKIGLFCRDTQKLFDDKILFVDLDCVITGSLDPLVVNGNANLLIHAKPIRVSFWGALCSKEKRRQRAFYKGGYKYNTGLMMFRKNTHYQICEDFDEERAVKLQEYYHVHGEDQSWVTYNIGRHKDIWTVEDGVHSYVSDMSGSKRACLPEGARIVMFGGSYKPWDESVLGASPWIRDHYPLSVL